MSRAITISLTERAKIEIDTREPADSVSELITKFTSAYGENRSQWRVHETGYSHITLIRTYTKEIISE